MLDYILSLLPPSFGNTEEDTVLLKKLTILSKLFGRSESHIEQGMEEIFIDGAEETLLRWENFLKLPTAEGLPVQQRQERILGKNIGTGRLNLEMLQAQGWDAIGTHTFCPEDCMTLSGEDVFVDGKYYAPLVADIIFEPEKLQAVRELLRYKEATGYQYWFSQKVQNEVIVPQPIVRTPPLTIHMASTAPPPPATTPEASNTLAISQKLRGRQSNWWSPALTFLDTDITFIDGEFFWTNTEMNFLDKNMTFIDQRTTAQACSLKQETRVV